MFVHVGVSSAREQTTNTLPPLYRQINREDRLVVREGVCVLGRRALNLPNTILHVHVHVPALTSYYSKQTNYMGIFTVSGWCMFVLRARDPYIYYHYFLLKLH